MAAISREPSRVESAIKVENKLMNMTLADEEKFYGSVDEYISQTIDSLKANGEWIERLEACPRTIDLVWEGWDAAFIKSKGENDWPVATLESTGLDLAVGERFKKVLGKRKLDDFSLVEEAEPESFFEFPEDIPPKKEFAVTLLAYQVLGRFWGWSDLESLVGPVCDAIRSRVFDCTVKFILSIFDEDDYHRICHRFKIQNEHMNFCSKHADDEASPLANLSRTNFSFFREADVYEACLQLHAYKIELSKSDDEPLNMSALQFHKVDAFGYDFSMFFLKVSDVPRSLELMQKHRPLKGYLQAQLMLELSRIKCFHVTDILILEAMKDLNLLEFYEQCTSDDDVSANECQKLLWELADIVVVGLEILSMLKADELRNAEKRLIGAPQCLFGTYKNEVFEVMKLANHERRMGDNRFIGLAHIWSALSFSRVRDCLPEIVSNYLCPELCLLDGSSEIYTFRLYELSHELASHLGDREVGLEHFVFSIVYGFSKETLIKSYYEPKRGLLFKSLRECDADNTVESWRNIDVYTTLLGKRCRFGILKLFKGREMVDKLQEVARTGRLLLPKYEDLRVV